MVLRRSVLPALVPLVAATLVACQSSSERNVGRVASMVRHGDYTEARVEAERLARLYPDDQVVQALARDARVAEVLEQGRRAVFRDEPNVGLEYFHAAAELAPDNAVVASWISKTRVQIAEETLDLATAETTEGELSRAEEYYERVLEVLPEDGAGRHGALDERIERLRVQANLGLSRVLLTQNYRAGQSRSYYQEGIRDFREFFLQRSQHDFGASILYDEENARAERRLREVEGVLADERLSKARTLEEDGMFHAAGKEYRLVLLLDPDNAEARDGFDRMDKETRAKQTLAEAEMSVYREEFDRASQLLGQAGDFTAEQQEAIGRLAADIEDQRLRALYEEARDFERDYRYPEAADAYRALLEETEFYEDAISRLATIEEFIALADEYYTAALDAETDEETANYLRRIPVFWPEYRDVDVRLAEVEARLAAAQAAAEEEPAPEGTPPAEETPEPDEDDGE